MAPKSATTPEAIREWASEWSDIYDQSLSVEKLSEWVGKKVSAKGVSRGEPKGFTGLVVGHSIDTLVLHEEETDVEVHRYSLIIDQGLQCSIFAGMEITEVSEEDE